MEATHPASQGKAGYLICPACVAQNLGRNRISHGLFCVLVVLGVAGGRGAWPWAPAPGGGSSQEAVTGEEAPSKARVAPWHHDVLQALVAPPHGERASPRNAETGRGCAVGEGLPQQQASRTPGPDSWLLEIVGSVLTPETPTTPLTTEHQASVRGLAAEPCSVSAGTGALVG